MHECYVSSQCVCTNTDLIQAGLVKQAFQVEREILVTASKHKTPKPVRFILGNVGIVNYKCWSMWATVAVCLCLVLPCLAE